MNFRSLFAVLLITVGLICCEKKATDSASSASELKNCLVGTWAGTLGGGTVSALYQADGTFTTKVSYPTTFPTLGTYYTYTLGTWEIEGDKFIYVTTTEGNSYASMETAISSAQAVPVDEQVKTEDGVYCKNSKMGNAPWTGGNVVDLTGTWQSSTSRKEYRKKDGAYSLAGDTNTNMTLNANTTGEIVYSITRNYYSGGWQSTPSNSAYINQVCNWTFTNGNTLSLKEASMSGTACTGNETAQSYEILLDGSNLIYPVFTKQ
jgi:hypothetical protein